MDKKQIESYEKHVLLFEAIKRLPNEDFWDDFKKHFNIKNIESFGFHCYDVLEAYGRALEGKVERIKQEAHKALDDNSEKEMKRIKGEITDNLLRNGELRFILKKQERVMHGILKGIDGAIKVSGKKPTSIFYRPKPDEKITENVVCPNPKCREENVNFEYNTHCRHCREIIYSPWEEHTICSNQKCGQIITRKTIFDDKEAFQLDPATGLINCPFCDNRFNWKEFREQPEKFCYKSCINCDRPFIPDIRNWRKQRICSDCRTKDINPFELDNPNYQKEYRESRKVKKK